ncbi:patatin-like phospholipase family protein [Candidatus Uabimicrobium sp. HlEnr_7]|uniref:patatin-like phospholipase family protein n=1 Tax=Candidatus Uabimicrobium helgolandensis TaxID=3095367 RepID=UPI003557B1BF
MFFLFRNTKSFFCKALCLLFCSLLLGCGVIIGTTVDAARNIVTYPLKEYVFWGAYKYDNNWQTPYKEIQIEKKYGDVLVGVAVSGGGSRSAYFFASIIKELHKIKLASKKSIVDEIDYISSVSGGSLASAYYCLARYNNKQSKNDPLFFDKFKKAMHCNFQIQALARILCGFWVLDLVTYYNRGDLLAGIWEDNFWGNATFRDLLQAEKNGAPKLIINGTDLSGGHKFVFSTIKDSQFNSSQYFKALREAGFIKHATTESHIPFKTIGFETLNSDISPYRVSKAVVASASVPNLLGPVTLRDYTQKSRFLNISDGGIYDNYGVESLMQIFTSILDKNPGMKAKIIIIDGSGYFDVDKLDSGDLDVAYYSQRPLEVSWLRTKNYMEYVFKQANKFTNKKGQTPYKNLEYEVLSLYDVLPSQEKSTSITGEKAIDSILRPDITTLNFFKKISSIQTNFAISSEDATIVDEVAKKVVHKLRNKKQ